MKWRKKAPVTDQLLYIVRLLVLKHINVHLVEEELILLYRIVWGEILLLVFHY